MVHELKIERKYFVDILAGLKTFEVRHDDRNYQPGDFLYMREYYPDKDKYGVLEMICCVTYILRDPAYCKDGFVIMGIRRMDIAKEDIKL